MVPVDHFETAPCLVLLHTAMFISSALAYRKIA